MVILSAQLEVAHHDSDLSTSENKDDENHEQETKNVIKLVSPKSSEDKEELNEDSSERKDASHEDRQSGAHVPNLYVIVNQR